MDLYNTISQAIHRFDSQMKQEIVNDESSWTLLKFSFIPFYGLYLINHKLDDLHNKISNPAIPNKFKLIDDYNDAAYVLVAACAVQALFLSLFPAIILSSELVLAIAQLTVGMGMMYACSKIESQVKDYLEEYLQTEPLNNN